MSRNSDFRKYDLIQLQTELQQEREVKEMLEQSVSDLRSTLCELQERLQSVDGEGNEWKTRHETQVELNGQLKRQISLIQERLEGLRGNPIDRLASIRSYDEMSIETLRHRLKLLTNEKLELQTQLMDCQHQIEQEGRAFHKTNDERRAYLSEIAKLSSTLDAQRRQYTSSTGRPVESKQKREKPRSWKKETDCKTEGPGVDVDEAAAMGGVTAERRKEKKSQRGSSCVPPVL